MKLRIKLIYDGHGGYKALCPSLPGCISRGNTREKATENLDEAIRGYMAAVNNFVPASLVHDVVEA